MRCNMMEEFNILSKSRTIGQKYRTQIRLVSTVNLDYKMFKDLHCKQ